ncbi:MAG: anthranilate synthase component I family protein [Alicyclobacillaceae bacterium]|nr:anthranilate synthase component I family protein [Alicyclobacillaceae bacterium]
MHERINAAATPLARESMRADGRIDPFYLYLDLVAELGEGNAFLLDAAEDEGSLYRMSMIGAVPVLEIQVKDGRVAVAAVRGLDEYVRLAAERAGWFPDEEVGERWTGGPSVVEGPRVCYHGVDPMAFLEQVRLALRRLAGSPQATGAVAGDAVRPPEHAARPGGEPFASGLLGYIGYDAVHYLEDLPKTTVDDRGLPDIRLQWHAVMVHLNGAEATVFDAAGALAEVIAPDVSARLLGRADLVHGVVRARCCRPREVPERLAAAAAGRPDEAERGHDAAEVVEDVSQAEFEDRVRRAVEYIQDGDIFQVVLSKRVRLPRRVHPYVAYERLRRLNPSPYMFMAEYPDMRLFGTSPEVQFRAVGGIAEMKPIAGTSKGRGQSAEEDEELCRRLLADEKERAEHVMLVDLCRNDLGRVCQVGSVQVTDLMAIERYSHLFHIVSTVQGRLRPDVSVFHALLATFPAGTLTGAPKIRAMEIIDELEQVRRGPYGGMIGIVDLDANANTAIVIRTVIECGGTYFVQAGAGIVADSQPEQEWRECGHKAGAMLAVLSTAASG